MQVTRAALWHVDEKECRDIDVRSSWGSWAHGLNGRGHVVGESRLDSLTDLGGFIWPNRPEEPPSAWRWDGLMPAGYRESHALSINDAGDVAGYATSRDRKTRGLIWKRGKALELSPLSGEQHSLAMSLDAAGRAVGNSFHDDRNQATFWDGADRPVALKLSDKYREMKADSIAVSISNGGLIAGSYWRYGKIPRQACLWVGEGAEFRDLQPASLGVTSESISVNQHGHVVGNYQTRNGETRGFLHDGSKMHDLTSLAKPPGGLVLQYPRMIDDRGWIVGTGTRGRGGPLEAFVMAPA
ncbi:hypothetical protein [Aquisphaera giovannonii]|uniref:hypothetical protein n=1 Tax=Aquisphaera giovannonii TaxID=406548 RepID=UPI00143D6624|nr:hypothetical protein [Aquisphaera giovannonii]